MSYSNVVLVIDSSVQGATVCLALLVLLIRAALSPQVARVLGLKSTLHDAKSESSLDSGRFADGIPGFFNSLTVSYKISERRHVQAFKAREKDLEYFIKCFDTNCHAEQKRYDRERSAHMEIQAFAGERFCPPFITSGMVHPGSSLGIKLGLLCPSNVLVTQFLPNTMDVFLRRKTSTFSAVRLAQSLICALHYLHGTVHLAHNDIKPENIGLVNAESVRIFDFDLAIKENQETIERGTPCFFSPEVVFADAGRPFKFEQVKKSDVYAAGLCIWTLMMACNPKLKRGAQQDTEEDVARPYGQHLGNIGLNIASRKDRRKAVMAEMRKIFESGVELEVDHSWCHNSDMTLLYTVWRECTNRNPQSRPTARIVSMMLSSVTVDVPNRTRETCC